jgi:hypothetical protein
MARGRRGLAVKLVALLRAVALMLIASASSAHEGGVSGYAAVHLNDNALRYELTLSALPAPLLAAADHDAARALGAARAALRAGLRISSEGARCEPVEALAPPSADTRVSVTLVIDYVCPGPIVALTLHDDSFDVFGPDLHILGRASLAGETREFTLATESREVALAFGSGAPSSPVARGFTAFLKLGVEHILLGYDHLLFLFALLLAPSRWQTTVRIVTAFTLAHSVTLALTALDVLRLPGVLVEAVIAGSIAYVAAENLWAKNPLSRRVWVTLLFGLVHGCGFASVLREIGLPTTGLWPALLGFNVGVEVGQLAVILLVLPLLHAIRRLKREAVISATLSAGVCAVGVWLLVQRVA